MTGSAFRNRPPTRRQDRSRPWRSSTKQSSDEVWFGATVTLKIDNETKLQKYQIVGVDEADVSKGKISFISPIAKILTGKEVGEKATLKLANGVKTLEIMEIVY